jgi:hypothetical protein
MFSIKKFLFPSCQKNYADLKFTAYMQKATTASWIVGANIRTANSFYYTLRDALEDVKNFEQIKIIVTFLQLKHTK